MEVERFWLPHKISVTAAFYFVNRYAGLLGYVPVLYQFLGMVDGRVRRSTLTSRPASNITPFHLQE